MSDFFDQQAPEKPAQERRYSHPGSDSMYSRPKAPKEPAIPEGERKFPNSPKMYGEQDGPRPGRQTILNHMTKKAILDQPGYLGPDGYKRAVSMHSKELRFARIESKDLSNIHMNQANLSNSKLTGVNFRNVKAGGANFNNAEVYNTWFDGSDLHGSSFRGVDLSGCSMRNCNLRGVDFTGAVLPESASLEGSEMEGAILSEE